MPGDGQRRQNMEVNVLPVALLNFSAFTPLTGTISQRTATVQECASLIEQRGYVSAVGHQGTVAMVVFSVAAIATNTDWLEK
jgi:hypothetical protein